MFGVGVSAVDPVGSVVAVDADATFEAPIDSDAAAIQTNAGLGR
jgi:hypothetical protein